jgi:cell division protein ZipA
MDGLRLALIVAGIAIIAVVYFVTARRRRIDREAGNFDRFDAWSDDERDPLVDDLPAQRHSSDDLGDRPDSDPGDGAFDDDALDDVPPLPPGWVPSAPAEPLAAHREPEPRTAPATQPAALTTPAKSTPGDVAPDLPGPVIDGLEAIAESLADRDDEPVLGDLPAMTVPPRPAPASATGVPEGRSARADPPPSVQAPRRAGGRRRTKKEVQTELALEPPAGEPELVIVLNVMAGAGGRFAGPALHEALAGAGLRYGEMQAYHFGEAGKPLFSVLNAVSPGTLNPADAATLATPGVALVMSLPGPETPLEAFETMHGVARALAAELGGQVCDASRSTLTRQASNHLREQISEYGRRKRLPG